MKMKMSILLSAAIAASLIAGCSNSSLAGTTLAGALEDVPVMEMSGEAPGPGGPGGGNGERDEMERPSFSGSGYMGEGGPGGRDGQFPGGAAGEFPEDSVSGNNGAPQRPGNGQFPGGGGMKGDGRPDFQMTEGEGGPGGAGGPGGPGGFGGGERPEGAPPAPESESE